MDYFRRLGRCVSAEPADDFADLFEPVLRKVFDAADPALVEVTFFGAFVWDKAEPAADFAALLELLLLNALDAADAAFLPVTSFFLLIVTCLLFFNLHFFLFVPS